MTFLKDWGCSTFLIRLYVDIFKSIIKKIENSQKETNYVGTIIFNYLIFILNSINSNTSFWKVNTFRPLYTRWHLSLARGSVPSGLFRSHVGLIDHYLMKCNLRYRYFGASFRLFSRTDYRNTTTTTSWFGTGKVSLVGGTFSFEGEGCVVSFVLCSDSRYTVVYVAWLKITNKNMHFHKFIRLYHTLQSDATNKNVSAILESVSKSQHHRKHSSRVPSRYVAWVVRKT